MDNAENEQKFEPAVGALLRASRLRVGEDLRDIAAILRIRYPYLEAIEEGRYQDLPGITYAVGFVRTYAEHLGLDADEVVRRFKSENENIKRRSDLVFPSPIPERGTPTAAVLFVGVLVAAVAYGAWYVATSEDSIFDGLVSPLPDRLATLLPGDADNAAEPTAPAETPAVPENMPLATPGAGTEPLVVTPPPAEPVPAIEPEAPEPAPEAAATPEPEAEPAPAEEAPAPSAEADTQPQPELAAPPEAPSEPEAPAVVPETAPAVPQMTEAPASEPAPAAEAVPQPEAAVEPTPQPEAAVPETPEVPEPAAEAPAPAPEPQATETEATEPQAEETVADVTETAPPPAPEEPVTEASSETQTSNAPEEPLAAEPAANEEQQAAAPAEADGEAVETETPAAAPATGTQAADGDHRIVVRARADSWIQVRDGVARRLLVTRLLRAGDSYRVPDRPGLTLLTGNAGALDILVDGAAVPAIGGEGTVRRNVALDAERLLAGTAVLD